MRTKRKSLIEERYEAIKRRQLSFMRMVQARVSKMKTSFTPFLPNDLMFKIFLLLPIKSLLRFRSVCKSWNKLIHCSEFVEAYNNEAQTTALFLRAIGPDRFNTFHVESEVNQFEAFSIFPCTPAETLRSNVMHFLEIEDGKSKIIDLNISCLGKIVATCNGLILISSMYQRKRTASRTRSGEREMDTFDSHERPGRLIIMNPMTRKFFGFPLGTLPHYSQSESYGLVFSHSKGVFKVVHLFKDELGHIACEVWSMETRYWKAIDGPPENAFRLFGPSPISTSGALHWLPGRYDHHIDYIVSMNAEDERFFVTNLPKSVSWYDKLVEMGGFLTFVSSLDMNHMEVWVLKGSEGTEWKWIKQHTINIDAIVGYVENKEYSVPVFAVNAKEMIFRRKKILYSYDFELEEATEIEMNGGSVAIDDSLIPHTNNLATWEPLEPMQ